MLFVEEKSEYYRIKKVLYHFEAAKISQYIV